MGEPAADRRLADDELAEHLAIAHGIVAGRLTKKARAALGL
jgi:predicted DNA-binding protein (MmcQ/YjbR family)